MKIIKNIPYLILLGVTLFIITDIGLLPVDTVETKIPTSTAIPVTSTPQPTPTMGFDPNSVQVGLDRAKEMGYKSLDEMISRGELNARIVTLVVEGESIQAYELADSNCTGDKALTVPGAILMFAEELLEQGVPPSELNGPLSTYAGETGYINWEINSQGDCELKHNNHEKGVPPVAFCMAQIYKPAHPNVDYERLKTDADYCVELGVSIYLGALRAANNDPILAAACYKGFCTSKYPNPKQTPLFVNNFYPTYKAGGISYNGTFIPFNMSGVEMLRQMVNK